MVDVLFASFDAKRRLGATANGGLGDEETSVVEAGLHGGSCTVNDAIGRLDVVGDVACTIGEAKRRVDVANQTGPSESAVCRVAARS